MHKVDQSILHGDPSGRPGNCVQACVASVLSLPVDQVPHFVEEHGTAWTLALEDWCEARGIEMTRLSGHRTTLTPAILCGSSPRSAGVNHAVVGVKGDVVHDPHPSRAGLKGLAVHTLTFAPVIMDWRAYLAENSEEEAKSTDWQRRYFAALKATGVNPESLVVQSMPFGALVDSRSGRVFTPAIKDRDIAYGLAAAVKLAERFGGSR